MVLGVLTAVLLVICWANGSSRLLSDSLGRAAILGAVVGILVAYSDVSLGLDGSTVVVRNPFLISRVPLSAVDAVDARLGVYLRIRDQKLAVRVGAATGLLRLRQQRPALYARELQDLVDGAAPGTDRPRARLKGTWLVAVPAGIALFLAVDVIAHAVG